MVRHRGHLLKAGLLLPRLWLPFAGCWHFNPTAGPGECCGEECINCQGAKVDYWTVTWAGLANQDPVDCNDCNDFNDDWIVDQYQQAGPIEEHRCQWYTELDPTICDAAYMKMSVGSSTNFGVTRYYIEACAGTVLNGACHVFQGNRVRAVKVYDTTKPACSTFTAESLTVSSAPGCDYSGATCTIAAGFNP